jgi:hypothetical protein
MQAVRRAYPVAAEVNSRIFWSIYTLDRLVSITLGRPMAGHSPCLPSIMLTS